MQISEAWLLNIRFSVIICSAEMDLTWVNRADSVRGPVAELMKPEMGVRGGAEQGSLISIYLNEYWHKLPHPLSTVKIK